MIKVITDKVSTTKVIHEKKWASISHLGWKTRPTANHYTVFSRYFVKYKTVITGFELIVQILNHTRNTDLNIVKPGVYKLSYSDYFKPVWALTFSLETNYFCLNPIFSYNHKNTGKTRKDNGPKSTNTYSNRLSSHGFMDMSLIHCLLRLLDKKPVIRYF